MFRALLARENNVMEAPIAITILEGKEAPAVRLSIQPEAIFATAVGHSSKRTMASWHVTTAQEIVEHMLNLVNDEMTTVPADDDVVVDKGKCGCCK